VTEPNDQGQTRLPLCPPHEPRRPDRAAGHLVRIEVPRRTKMDRTCRPEVAFTPQRKRHGDRTAKITGLRTDAGESLWCCKTRPGPRTGLPEAITIQACARVPSKRSTVSCPRPVGERSTNRQARGMLNPDVKRTKQAPAEPQRPVVKRGGLDSIPQPPDRQSHSGGPCTPSGRETTAFSGARTRFFGYQSSTPRAGFQGWSRRTLRRTGPARGAGVHPGR